jgi:hypothetical protein
MKYCAAHGANQFAYGTVMFDYVTPPPLLLF